MKSENVSIGSDLNFEIHNKFQRTEVVIKSLLEIEDVAINEWLNKTE